VDLGTENKKKVIWASALGGVALLVVIYQLIPSSSSSTSAPGASTAPVSVASKPARTPGRRSSAPAKKARPQSLDPTLHLTELAAAEQVKYEGSGRNIFTSQAEDIPKPVASAVKDQPKEAHIYEAPPPPPPPPIPLKFFGFASGPGEPKKIFLSKGEDVFIAGEGEIVDRRYKVLHITPTSVEMQDVVGSGPPQSLPLVQG
jgi:hypothetical protein